LIIVRFTEEVYRLTMTRMIASKISDTEYEALVKIVRADGSNVSAVFHYVNDKLSPENFQRWLNQCRLNPMGQK
jgi:hypothetical protein